MDDGNEIMPPSQYPKRLLKPLGLKVADEKDHRPSGLNPPKVVQSPGDIGPGAPGTERENFPNDPKHVPGSLARWDEHLHLVGEDDEPHLVVVLDGGKGEQSAQISAASSFLVCLTDPKLPEALRSTRNMTVSSRSSRNCLMKGLPARAVTFQSMLRTSSPTWYSRTSSNSIPRPLKTLSYSPARTSLTTLVV